VKAARELSQSDMGLAVASRPVLPLRDLGLMENLKSKDKRSSRPHPIDARSHALFLPHEICKDLETSLLKLDFEA
jgi:hypothetical protein